MTREDRDFIDSHVPVEHAERIAARVRSRIPSSRAKEMAMASAAMSGVSLGMWIVASLADFQTSLTVVAIILTLATSALAAVASRDFHSLSEAVRALRSENERMADNLWEASESEERATSLFDQMGDLVVVFDARRIISDANLNFMTAIGMSMNDIVGKPLSSLGIEISRNRSRPVTTPQDVNINGRWYSWIEFRSPTAASLDKPLFRAVARDIHQHKEGERLLVEARQRAEAANEAKSQFLATVSHEIRTPLNGITGMSRLLADTPLTPEQKTYLDAISASGQALITLIEDILDFSKIEAGRMDLRPEKVELRPFAESIVELIAARAHHKGIGIGLWVAEDVQGEILTDPDRLRQALLNLLGNAVKFTESGGVALEIVREQGFLRFNVRDNGPGIDQADQDRIFGEFEQAEVGKTRRHGGAGLGLAITRRIVTAMGGNISVESQPGAGATFSILLPDFAAPALSQAKPWLGKTCRVVMASALESATLAKMVSSLGATVDCQGESQDQTTPAQTGNYDVLLMDVASWRDPSIALPTAKRRIILIEPGERGQMGELIAEGFETYLVRPVRQKTLMRALAGTMANEPVVLNNDRQGGSRTFNRPLSVLVAEDNEINALLVRSALVRAGHTVTVVGDGKSAVDHVLSGATAHDVVLMDLHMPVMDGLDAIAAIRSGEDERGLKPIPVLALTADGQDEVEKTVRSVGGNGFVVKPVDPARLVGLVEETAAAA